MELKTLINSVPNPFYGRKIQGAYCQDVEIFEIGQELAVSSRSSPLSEHTHIYLVDQGFSRVRSAQIIDKELVQLLLRNAREHWPTTFQQFCLKDFDYRGELESLAVEVLDFLIKNGGIGPETLYSALRFSVEKKLREE